MKHGPARRPLLLAVGVLALIVVAPPARANAPSSAASTALSAKASQSLRAIVANGLGDQLYGSVVQHHVPGTVYYLAQLSSIDDPTLQLLQRSGATVRQRFDLIGWVALSSPSAKVAGIAALPQVVRMVSDKVVDVLSATATKVPAAAVYGDQAKRGTHDIGADTLWPQGITGTGVKVGVVDSGMDSTHGDLGPKIYDFVNCMGVVPDLVNDTNGIGELRPSPASTTTATAATSPASRPARPPATRTCPASPPTPSSPGRRCATPAAAASTRACSPGCSTSPPTSPRAARAPTSSTSASVADLSTGRRCSPLPRRPTQTPRPSSST